MKTNLTRNGRNLAAALMTASVLLLSSCGKEEGRRETARKLIRTTFTFGNGTARSGTEAATRSRLADETDRKITTVRIGLYEAGDRVEERRFNGGEPIELYLEAETAYSLYAAVNPDENFSFPETESRLSDCAVPIPTAGTSAGGRRYGESLNATGMPMAGKLLDFRPGPENDRFEIHLKRLFTKVEISFETPEDVTEIGIRKAELRNVSPAVRPFAETRLDTEETANLVLEEAADGGETFHKSDKMILYVPESIGSGASVPRLYLDSYFRLGGVLIEKAGEFPLGRTGSAVRNTCLRANYFTDLFKMDEGGIIIDPWEPAETYVAQARICRFNVTGSSNFTVGTEPFDLNENGVFEVLEKIPEDDHTKVSVRYAWNAGSADFDLVLRKGGRETDRKRLRIEAPLLKFDAETVALSNNDRLDGVELGLSYYEKDGDTRIPVSPDTDFRNGYFLRTPYLQNLVPVISLNAECPASTGCELSPLPDAGDGETRAVLRYLDRIGPEDAGLVEDALLGKPTDATGIGAAGADLELNLGDQFSICFLPRWEYPCDFTIDPSTDLILHAKDERINYYEPEEKEGVGYKLYDDRIDLSADFGLEAAYTSAEAIDQIRRAGFNISVHSQDLETSRCFAYLGPEEDRPIELSDAYGGFELNTVDLDEILTFEQGGTQDDSYWVFEPAFLLSYNAPPHDHQPSPGWDGPVIDYVEFEFMGSRELTAPKNPQAIAVVNDYRAIYHFSGTERKEFDFKAGYEAGVAEVMDDRIDHLHEKNEDEGHFSPSGAGIKKAVHYGSIIENVFPSEQPYNVSVTIRYNGKEESFDGVEVR